MLPLLPKYGWSGICFRHSPHQTPSQPFSLTADNHNSPLQCKTPHSLPFPPSSKPVSSSIFFPLGSKDNVAISLSLKGQASSVPQIPSFLVCELLLVTRLPLPSLCLRLCLHCLSLEYGGQGREYVFNLILMLQLAVLYPFLTKPVSSLLIAVPPSLLSCIYAPFVVTL